MLGDGLLMVICLILRLSVGVMTALEVRQGFMNVRLGALYGLDIYPQLYFGRLDFIIVDVNGG